MDSMIFLDMHTLQEADHFGLCYASDLTAVMDPGICYKLSFDAFAGDEQTGDRFGNLRLYPSQMGSVSCWGVRIFGVKHRSVCRLREQPTIRCINNTIRIWR